LSARTAFGADEAQSRPRLVLALLCVAQFVVVLDVTIVNVALPAIRFELGLADGTAHWVISAYAVVFAAALLTGGRAADVFGRRQSFVVGLLVFTLCSLVAGFAWSGPTLIAARAAQGLGAALLSPAAFSLLVATFPDGPARDRALGVWASVGGFAAIAGVAGGGLVTEALSWRWIFLANVPLGAAAVALVPVLLARSEDRTGRRLDLPTLALATVGLGATVLLVSSLGHRETTSLAVPSAATAVGALLTLWLRQRRAHDRLVPVVLLRDRSALGANLAGFLYGGLMLAGFLLLTLAMQVGLGYSTTRAGLGLVAPRAASVLGSRVAARAAGRIGHRPVLAVGMAAMVVAFASFARIEPGSAYVSTLLPGLIVLGFGIPLLFVASAAISVERVPDEHSGIGAGLLSTCQWLGGAIGVSLVPAIGSGTAQADLRQLRAAFLVCAGVATAGLVLATILARTASPPARLHVDRHLTQADESVAPRPEPVAARGRRNDRGGQTRAALRRLRGGGRQIRNGPELRAVHTDRHRVPVHGHGDEVLHAEPEDAGRECDPGDRRRELGVVLMQ
jgi:EmrB/QacA subfamily drug resistance transporter